MNFSNFSQTFSTIILFHKIQSFCEHQLKSSKKSKHKGLRMKYEDFPQALPDEIVKQMAMEYNKSKAQTSEEQAVSTKSILEKLELLEAYMTKVASTTQRKNVRETFLKRIEDIKAEQTSLIEVANIQNHKKIPPSLRLFSPQSFFGKKNVIDDTATQSESVNYEKVPRHSSFNNCYHGYLRCEMALIHELIRCCCFSKWCDCSVICAILIKHFGYVDCYFCNTL